MEPETSHEAMKGGCPLCGAPLNPSRDACTRCDWVAGYRQNKRKLEFRANRDIAAAVLSIVPGAGHMLKGYMMTGLAILLVTPVVIFFMAALNLFAGWVVPLFFWPAVMFDAYFRRDLKTKEQTSQLSDRPSAVRPREGRGV